jgi:hypothetical protein
MKAKKYGSVSEITYFELFCVIVVRAAYPAIRLWMKLTGGV